MRVKQGREMVDICLRKRGLISTDSDEKKGKRRYYYHEVSITSNPGSSTVVK